MRERQQDYALNAAAMEKTKAALDADEDGRAILAALASQPPGRAYAGRRKNWGQGLRVGSLYFYDLLTFHRVAAITPYENVSLNSDLVWHLDDRNPGHYNLFNVRDVVAPPSFAMPSFLRPINKTPRYVLYRADTSGYTESATVTAASSVGSQSALFSRNVGCLAGPGAAAGRFVRYHYPAGSGLASDTADAASPSRAPLRSNGDSSSAWFEGRHRAW